VLTLDTRAATLDIELASPARLPRLIVRAGDRLVFDRVQPFAPAELATGDTLRVSFGGR
jgi:hypothetical protein